MSGGDDFLPYVVHLSWTGDREQSTLWTINAREDDGHPIAIMPAKCLTVEEWTKASADSKYSKEGPSASHKRHVTLLDEALAERRGRKLDAWHGPPGAKGKRLQS